MLMMDIRNKVWDLSQAIHAGAPHSKIIRIIDELFLAVSAVPGIDEFKPEENQPLQESFPVIHEDPELRVIGIMLMALERHVLPKCGVAVMDESFEPARRVVRYLSSRMEATKSINMEKES